MRLGYRKPFFTSTQDLQLPHNFADRLSVRREEEVRAGRRLWQLWVVIFVLGLPLRSGAVPSDADELGEWWDGAGQFWLGDTAYEASGHILDDGLCRASFDEGVLIPVHSGADWQSSRIVGLVFVGTGQLEVSFSSRARNSSTSLSRSSLLIPSSF